MKRDILNRVVIPSIQAILVGLIGLAFGFVIANEIIKSNENIITIIFGLVACCGWLIYGFISSKNLFENQMLITQPLVDNKTDASKKVASPQAIEPVVNVTLISNNGKEGDIYYIKGFDNNTIEQIAWGITFCGGSLAHNFLDEKTGLLNRVGVKKFHAELISSRLATEKIVNGKKCGVVLTDQGRELFTEWAMIHNPSPTERERLKNYIRTKSI